jgi:opacity protein-like surface antigen
MMKRIAALAVLAVALGAVVASADATDANTSATTKYRTGFAKVGPTKTYAGVKGRIKSPKTSCLKNRKIVSLAKTPETGKWKKTNTGRTNAKGYFAFDIGITGFLPKGLPVYVKVQRKKVATGKGLCGVNKSRTFGLS